MTYLSLGKAVDTISRKKIIGVTAASLPLLSACIGESIYTGNIERRNTMRKA
jgi:hypothetical protein